MTNPLTETSREVVLYAAIYAVPLRLATKRLNDMSYKHFVDDMRRALAALDAADAPKPAGKTEHVEAIVFRGPSGCLVVQGGSNPDYIEYLHNTSSIATLTADIPIHDPPEIAAKVEGV